MNSNVPVDIRSVWMIRTNVMDSMTVMTVVTKTNVVSVDLHAYGITVSVL